MEFSDAISELESGGAPLEAVERLLLANPQEEKELFSLADETRERHVGKSTCVHGVLEFSNFCKNSCLYCGIRKESPVKRYRMQPDEIVENVAWAAKELGYKMVVLQSGEDRHYTGETLCELAREIKKRCNIILFFSIGDRTQEEYASLKKAGADGVLYRFETSSSELFEKMRPGTSFGTRMAHLSFFHELKYLVATGFIIGLPHQSSKQLAQDILSLGKLKANMISIGPFLPSPLTPLASQKSPSLPLALRALAICRLLYKKVRMPVTTAFETLDPAGRQKAIFAGANSLMVNITPRKYSQCYSIYPNRFGEREEIEKLTREAIEFVQGIGRRVCRGYAKDLRPQFSAPACAE
ncbi:MAG: radical SAM protein [Candidatus Micrarchaeota archaeon]|nr:radical SAM protein [Candidatus Micrarchaeota archaeon]